MIDNDVHNKDIIIKIHLNFLGFELKEQIGNIKRRWHNKNKDTKKQKLFFNLLWKHSSKRMTFKFQNKGNWYTLIRYWEWKTN